MFILHMLLQINQKYRLLRCVANTSSVSTSLSYNSCLNFHVLIVYYQDKFISQGTLNKHLILFTVLGLTLFALRLQVPSVLCWTHMYLGDIKLLAYIQTHSMINHVKTKDTLYLTIPLSFGYLAIIFLSLNLKPQL